MTSGPSATIPIRNNSPADLEAAYSEFARSILDSARASTVAEFGAQHSLKDLPTKEVWFKMEALGKSFLLGLTRYGKLKLDYDPENELDFQGVVIALSPDLLRKGQERCCNAVAEELSRQLTCLETLINLDKNQSFLNLLTKFNEVRARYAQRNRSATHIPDLRIRNSQEGVEIASISFPAEATAGCLQKATVTIFRHDDSPTFLINQNLNSWGENIIKLTDAFGGEPHVLLLELLNALTIHKNHLKLLNPLNTLTNTPHRHKPPPT